MQHPPEDAEREARLAIFCRQLVGMFGADACDVVERQLDVAEGEAGATWIAIWERLCAAEARRA